MIPSDIFLFSRSDLRLLNSPHFIPDEQTEYAYKNDTYICIGGSQRNAVQYLAYWKKVAQHRLRKVLGLPRGQFHAKETLAQLAKTNILMPFCPSAAVWAADAGHDIVFPGAFCDDSDWVDFAPHVLKKTEEWLRSFPWEGSWSANWARLGGLHFYTMLYAHELALKIGPRLAECFKYFHYIHREPQTRETDSCSTDVALAVWAKMFPEKMKPLARCSRDALTVPLSGKNHDLYDGSLPEGAILFCMGGQEIKRMLPLIRATTLESKRSVVVCYYSSIGRAAPLDDIAQLVSAAGATPVFIDAALYQEQSSRWIPPTPGLQKSLSRHFLHADAHFDYWNYTERYQWPQYEGLLEFFRHFMKKHTPICCITTEPYMNEFSIPRIAAQENDILTIGVPHSYGDMGFPLNGKFVISHMLCTTKLQKNVIKKNHAVQSCIALKQLDLTNEYICQDIPLDDTCKNRIIFFHSAIQHPNYLFFHSEPKRHIDTLSSIFRQIPDEIKLQSEILHKVHPGNPDLGTLALAGVGRSSILPTQCSVRSAFEKSHIAVLYNYAGPPFLHALGHDIPAILFLERRQALVNYFHTKDFCEILGNYGLLMAARPDELWGQIARLLHDNAYREEILSRQRLFRDEQLATDRDDWNEWLEGVIQKKSGVRIMPDTRP